MTFAYIFTSKLSNEIGWKFFSGNVGYLPGLGKVTTMALTILVGNMAESAAELKMLHRVGARICWNCLKYSPVKPSGPGDLELGSLLITFKISAVVKGSFSAESCCGVKDRRLVPSRKVWIYSGEG